MSNIKFQWAPRVKMAQILQLYSQMARGLCDEALVDEIAYAFDDRCRSIIEVMEAGRGRVRCHGCGNALQHSASERSDVLRCDKCGWAVTWGEFLKSYQGKQLHGGTAYPYFQQYVDRLSRCNTANEKVLLIDWIIHQCHVAVDPNLEKPIARPAAVNLIAATVSQIIPFLDTLPLAPDPELRESYRKWQELMAETIRPK
ncbi:MAG: hypothetical protein IT443_02715 [Phycisphaeraceae bacterium]|nr:hypothetical protein [Phycisphaeraceae bacterium]